MRLNTTLLLLPIAIAISTSKAYAGAWTEDQGNTLVIVSASTYSASEMYGNSGDTRPQAGYHQYNFNPYVEYGLRDDITLGANVLLQSADQSGQSNWGLGDSEFFLRKRLWQQDGFVVSVEPLIKLPSPSSSHSDQPQLGNSHTDAALGLSAGYGFSAYGQNHFIDLDTQYRYRFGPEQNQIKLDASAGIGLTSQWMIMPQAFLTYRTADPTSPVYTNSSGDDYNLVRLQLSAVYSYTPSTAFQFGGFDDVSGKNTGEGKGILLSIWKHI